MEGSRTSRSDEGIIELTTSVFEDIFGLKQETSERIMRIIRNQGQWQDLKNAVRTLSGVAHRRLNDVVTMAQQRVHDERVDGVDDEFANGDETGDEEFNPDQQSEYGDRDERGISHEFEEKMREEKLSFAGYLLAELQYSDQDLRDPQKKQEIMRLMRAGDSQAEQLVTRGEREQKQAQRMDVQQEKDPRKVSLRRKKLMLQRQILQIDKELGEPGTEQGPGNEATF